MYLISKDYFTKKAKQGIVEAQELLDECLILKTNGQEFLAARFMVEVYKNMETR